jgi:hypothetical protein
MLRLMMSCAMSLYFSHYEKVLTSKALKRNMYYSMKLHHVSVNFYIAKSMARTILPNQRRKLETVISAP